MNVPVVGEGPFWEPECWSKSPMQLQEEARAMNLAAMATATRSGGRHSNGPAPAGRDRRL